MLHKRLIYQLFARFGLLLLTLIGLAACLEHTHLMFVNLGLAVLAIVQTVFLAQFIGHTNSEVARFLLAIRHQDFSQHFNATSRETSLRELYHSFNEVILTFRSLRAEKEGQYQFLQTIIDFMETGILCYGISGKVELMNNAVKSILDIPYMNQITALSIRSPLFWETISRLKTGESEVVNLGTGALEARYLVSVTIFRNMDRDFKLISVQNVSLLLDSAQSEAWKKLMRILTHEIMNSIAPIASLADTLNIRMSESLEQENELKTDLQDGLAAIQKRSHGLLKFVEAYRNLNNIPKPQMTTLAVEELLENLYDLMQPEMQRRGIVFTLSLPDIQLYVAADIHLIEQVLINLMKNAMDAVAESITPKISLSAFSLQAGQVQIMVSDNGPGIAPELADQIFVPFFSTRKSGSGVGLSLSREIMQMHKGSISVRTSPLGGAGFVLAFALPSGN